MLQFMQKVHNALLRRASSRTNLLVSRAFASAASGSLDSERNNGSKVQAWIDTLDPLLKRKIQYIQNEVAVRSFDSEFPIDADTLTVTDYQTLLTKSNRDRHRHYNYLYKNRLAEKEKNDARAIRHLVTEQDIQRKAEDGDGSAESHIEYGLGKCSLIPRIFPRMVSGWKNRKIHHHTMLQNEQKLIFDCGFEHEMTGREIHDIVQGLVNSFGKNRDHCSPFVMHFCNINPNGMLWRNLSNYLPKNKCMPVCVHHVDFIDIFDRDRLVILTNDSPNVLTEFDAEVHYVLGAIIRRSHINPFMQAKAKEMNIRTARLPFDMFRRFRTSKALPLDQLTDILLEVRRNRDWNKAFEFIDGNKLQ